MKGTAAEPLFEAYGPGFALVVLNEPLRAGDLLAFDNAIRDGRLLTPKMRAWFLRAQEEPTGRAAGRNAIAGGTPGANAVMDAQAGWGVFVVSNLDPPSANRVAPALVGALTR